MVLVTPLRLHLKTGPFSSQYTQPLKALMDESAGEYRAFMIQSSSKYMKHEVLLHLNHKIGGMHVQITVASVPSHLNTYVQNKKRIKRTDLTFHLKQRGRGQLRKSSNEA